MELAELILEYLKVLIWPAVVVGVLVAFRREITARIRTSNIEFGTAGVTIKATAATAAQLAARRLGGGGEAKVETFTLMRPLRVRPRAARPERQVEAAFRTLAEMGVRDPDLDLFLAVFDDDDDAAARARDAGANADIRDSDLLARHAKAIESPEFAALYAARLADAPEITAL